MKPTDLRGILHYIPQFRDKVFIIAIDGAVVGDDNFPNLLLDIAVLRSLSIQIVIVHGAGHQIKLLSEELGKPYSNWDGTGITDAQTLRLAMLGANAVTHEILEGLSANNLRGAQSNAIEAVPLGIIKGVDYQHTGKVHQVDVDMLRTLLDKGVVPVLPPLGFDGNGHTYRINSDAVAIEVARALGAVKLMLITTRNGLEVDGKLLAQLTVVELAQLLKTSADKLPPDSLSKAQHALRASESGIPRVHIINGQVDEGLLAEVFSNEGIGTLIYANEYQGIRQAMRKDIRHIFALIKPSILGDQLLKRSRASIEKHINEYFVFEIDDNIVGCVAITPYPADKKAELACLQVNPAHEHRGIGTKLAVRAESVAKDLGMETIFCLSTQAFTFFQHKLGYREGTVSDLPAARREKYEQSHRNSKILWKPVSGHSTNGAPTREPLVAATT
ncbi:MAG: Amino-acid acetyltransferase [Verrucomicrobiae bacterium]|nr:Amino-acid acetyltransferase [Verrucomicrobiae bacterium]